MKSLRWLLAPVLVVGFAACGSDGGNSSADWCDLARDLESDTSAIDEMDVTDPDSVKAAFEDLADKVDEAADAAPDEIKDAVDSSKGAIDEMLAALEDADYNILDVDQEAFSQIGDDMDDASSQIDEYNEEECGIEPSAEESTDDTFPTDDGATDDGSTDDTVASGTAREQMAAVFESMGLDAEQATCVSENVDPSMAAEAETNPMALLDVFETCGVSLEDLAEIGQNSGG